ncbi:MAG TPA: ribonuclease catalytic domain-containing protein, partial [Nitriliruptorales bacterium]
GLDSVEATTTHLRHLGTVAGGGRGPAAGLATDGEVPGSYMHPVDRQDEACITIDDASTRDVDDAIVAHWDHEAGSAVEVAVHIADVAAYIGIDSPADHYARTVATSTYFAVGPNAPMLDPALSESTLSLLPNEERWAISVRFQVQPDGTVSDVSVEHVAVQSRAKLTYSALDQWLDGDATDLYELAGNAGETAEDLLINAVEAAYRLGVERESRDTFEELFDDAELLPAVVDGKLTTIDAEPHARAYRLIERLMVAANEAVAGWLVEREVPALYRAHVGLDPERAGRLRAAVELAGAKVEALDDPQAEVDDVMGQLLREIERLESEGRTDARNLLVATATGSTARATYDPDPMHHRGLAAGAYCHFTSPIRRYADLVVHRQIRATLAGEEVLHHVEDLASLARWLDARAGAAKHLQARERGDLWAILIDRGLLRQPEDAVVTGVTNNGLRIRLPRLGLNGFLTAEKALGLSGRERGSLKVDEHGLTTTSGPWRVGSRIKVRATSLDETGRPVFHLVDPPKPPAPQPEAGAQTA